MIDGHPKGQSQGKVGHVILIQLEGALTVVVTVVAVTFYTKMDQVPIDLNRGGEGGADSGTLKVLNVQRFQGFHHPGQWCHALRCGGAAL